MTDTRDLTINLAATVNDILLQHRDAVSVFPTFGIDAFCGGNASLEEAARGENAR